MAHTNTGAKNMSVQTKLNLLRTEIAFYKLSKILYDKVLMKRDDLRIFQKSQEIFKYILVQTSME